MKIGLWISLLPRFDNDVVGQKKRGRTEKSEDLPIDAPLDGVLFGPNNRRQTAKPHERIK
jgi:hypothetical protein